MEEKEEECVEGEGLYIQTTICLCLYLDKRKHVDTKRSASAHAQ